MRDLVRMKKEKLVLLANGAARTMNLLQSRKNFKFLKLSVGYGNDGHQVMYIPTTHDFIYIELPAGAGNDINKIVTCYKWVSDTQLVSQAAKIIKCTPITTTAYSCLATSTNAYAFAPITTIWGVL